MNKVLAALAMILSLSLFGAGAVSALDSSPTTVTQDGDKGKKKQDGKKKHGKKKHKKGKGKKKGGKKHGKKHGKKGGKKKNNRKKND